ncbi:hypothetical protein ACFL6A_02830 [bacterium]
METAIRFRKMKIIAVCEIIMALGIISFWITFFSTDMVQLPNQRLEEIYLAFENAFPVPDLWLSISLIIGAIGLLKVKFFGILFSLTGGASLIFLGLLDVSFNTQNGMYLLTAEDAIFNGLINLACLVFGTLLICIIWKNKMHWISLIKRSCITRFKLY